MTKKKDPLVELREGIDALDDEILARLNARAKLAQEVGRVKASRNQRAYAPERERQVVARLLEKSQGPLPEASLRLIYKEIISASLALESALNVVYLGPEATFTHEATKRHFGMSARLEPRRSIVEVFSEVERGGAEFGVVPIENSTEGVVSHTLDSFTASDLVICGEVLLPISHHLLNKSGELRGVGKVYSHPQAFAQCRAWLAANLPGVPLVDVSSTARAAELAREDASTAAVASDLAASLYELQPAASHIEDLRGNVTRFLVIADATHAPGPTGADRTSLMFALKDEAGVLYRALKSFAERSINMSRIESRPSRKKAWEYLFFIDLDGHQKDERVAAALSDLAAACDFMKVLGSYPAAKAIG